jgi:protein ImuB
MLWLGVRIAQFPAGLSWDERSERDALARLAGWAGRFTPTVSLAPPRDLLLEVEGSLRLFGGSPRLVERVEEGLKELGYVFGTALAPTPLAAILLARGLPGTRLTDRRRLEHELMRVPLGALDAAPGTLTALRGVGAATLGDCLRLPRAGLARRVDPDLLRVLDRALGRIPDPRAPFVPPPRYEGSLALPVAVASVEPLLFAARRLLLELEGYLEARGSGAAALGWTLRHHGGRSTRVDVGLAAPARDPGHLLKLLRERLERTRLEGPVEGVELAVGEILPLAPANLDLWTAREPHVEQAWPELLDRLRARLGADAVQGLRLAADHRPERAFVRTAPDGAFRFTMCSAGSSKGTPPLLHPSMPAPITAAARPFCRETGFGPRPLWLLSAPVSIPLKPPASPFRKGGERGFGPGGMTLVAGPERIESGWWDGGDVQRDYFVAEDRSGLRLWVFRERAGERRWFLHGIFG